MQVGSDRSIISEINFFLKTIKSFVKDLNGACQNCDHREEPTAGSETCWTSEHEGLLNFLRLKIDRRRHRREPRLWSKLTNKERSAISVAGRLDLGNILDGCSGCRLWYS